MPFRFLLVPLLAVALGLPAAVPASQPEVSFADLQPAPEVTPLPLDLALLLLDPYRQGELAIVLPQDAATLVAAPAMPE